jgi:hypothetical protein
VQFYLRQGAIRFKLGDGEVVFLHEPEALQAVGFHQVMHSLENVPRNGPVALLHESQGRMVDPGSQAISFIAVPERIVTV